jgi:fructosamine-3-kinase
LRFGGVELPVGSVEEGSPWPAHYAARLELLSGVALDRGRISSGCAEAVGRVIERIDALAGPEEAPARVHGDLWSGNVHAGADGRPWLIDPAAHGGHRELDLAMLRLFGTVSERTLAAYEDVEPLAEGHDERVGLWQLQPLLVHAILFGGSYGAAVERTAARYC